MTPERSQKWLDYFQSNRYRGGHLPWDGEIQLTPISRQAIGRTLQRFQLGESGEGLWLKKWAAQQNPVYLEAIELFVAEEQQHSRWMAQLLTKLGTPLLKSHWSDKLFVFIRRANQLHFELMLFLVAEVIAKDFFRVLATGIQDPLCSALFHQLVRDEAAHIQFHVEALQEEFAPLSQPRKIVQRVVWRALFGVTLLIVLHDHRASLLAAGVNRLHFWRRSLASFDAMTAKVFGPARSQLINPTVHEWACD